MSETLPQELIEVIISFCHDDLATLQTLSLVNSSWLPASRKLGFREVTVDDRDFDGANGTGRNTTVFDLMQSEFCTITPNATSLILDLNDSAVNYADLLRSLLLTLRKVKEISDRRYRDAHLHYIEYLPLSTALIMENHPESDSLGSLISVNLLMPSYILLSGLNSLQTPNLSFISLHIWDDTSMERAFCMELSILLSRNAPYIRELHIHCVGYWNCSGPGNITFESLVALQSLRLMFYDPCLTIGEVRSVLIALSSLPASAREIHLRELRMWFSVDASMDQNVSRLINGLLPRSPHQLLLETDGGHAHSVVPENFFAMESFYISVETDVRLERLDLIPSEWAEWEQSGVLRIEYRS